MAQFYGSFYSLKNAYILATWKQFCASLGMI